MRKAARVNRDKLPVRARVKIYCAEQGLTQGQLADYLGITREHFSALIARRQTASLQLAVTLEKLIGVPAKDFIKHP